MSENKKIKNNKTHTYKIKKNNSQPVPSVISKMKAKEIELTIICVLVILLILGISSYIIFSSIRKTNKYNTYKIDSFEVVFNKDNNGVNDIINIMNEKPIKDNDSNKLKPYTFSIKNKSSKTKEYVITIEEDTDMIEKDKCSNRLYETKYIKYSIDNKKALSLEKMDKTYNIFTEKLKPNESKKHSIRVWLSSEISSKDDMSNKHFHAKIIINSLDNKEEILIP